MKKHILPALIIITFLLNYAKANEISLHGFGLVTYSGRTKTTDEKRDLILGEERLRLNLSGASEAGNAGFNAKADFIHDGINNETKVDLREAYVDLIEKNYDVRIGRQVITWGLGDLLFINDIFPKDWNAFYAGRDMEYLKLGAEAVKLGIYPKFASMELVVLPAFQADEMPSPDKFIFNDPFAGMNNKSIIRPDKKIRDMELASRIYRRIGSGDMSIYAYKGFYHTPKVNIYDSLSVNYFYPKLNAYGASCQLNGLGGVISVEGGYYDSRYDKNGENFFIDNSKYKALLGYGRQITNQLHLGLQYYNEITRDYNKYKENLPQGFPREEKTKQILTLRLTQFLKYESWKLSLFTFYGIDEKDSMLIPEAMYKFSDELALTIGGNIIDGDKEWTTFGQFKENDNVYMRMKYDY
ncbi:MAG: DUF1302 family protein [bacterium]